MKQFVDTGNWPIWMIAVATVMLIVYMSIGINSLITDQRQLIEQQTHIIEAAEQRTALLLDHIDVSVDTIHSEIRQPTGGERAEIFDSIRRIEDTLGHIQHLLEEETSG